MLELSARGRLLLEHRSEIPELADEHGITNVGVFGSTVKDTDGPDSDIDLVVDMAPSRDLFDLARFEIAVARFLGHPVDVVPANSLKPRIAAEVLFESVPL